MDLRKKAIQAGNSEVLGVWTIVQGRKGRTWVLVGYVLGLMGCNSKSGSLLPGCPRIPTSASSLGIVSPLYFSHSAGFVVASLMA